MRMLNVSLIAISCFTIFSGCTPSLQKEQQQEPRWTHSGMSYFMPLDKRAELTKRADGGDANAAYELGKAWLLGDGNGYMGVYWFYRSAISGNADAQYYLASIYSGNSPPFTPESARYWLEKSAMNGNVKAIEELEESKKISKRLHK